MMRAWAAAVVLVAACGASDREEDCAKVREILVPPRRSDVPRRYWSYEQGSGARVVDVSPYDRLKQTTWRTAEIRGAVAAFVEETGWISYSPYYDASKASSATETLFRTCKVPGMIGVSH